MADGVVYEPSTIDETAKATTHREGESVMSAETVGDLLSKDL